MEDYKSLLDRMKAAQIEQFVSAATAKALPTDSAMRKIADLEIAIGALEHLIDDGAFKKR